MSWVGHINSGARSRDHVTFWPTELASANRKETSFEAENRTQPSFSRGGHMIKRVRSNASRRVAPQLLPLISISIGRRAESVVTLDFVFIITSPGEVLSLRTERKRKRRGEESVRPIIWGPCRFLFTTSFPVFSFFLPVIPRGVRLRHFFLFFSFRRCFSVLARNFLVFFSLGGKRGLRNKKKRMK